MYVLKTAADILSLMSVCMSVKESEQHVLSTYIKTYERHRVDHFVTASVFHPPV